MKIHDNCLSKQDCVQSMAEKLDNGWRIIVD